MSEFDVRTTDESQIHLIRFHSKSGDYHNRPCYLTKTVTQGLVAIYTSEPSIKTAIVIENKQHALNLIKALQKSIELGWYNEQN